MNRATKEGIENRLMARRDRRRVRAAGGDKGAVTRRRPFPSSAAAPNSIPSAAEQAYAGFVDHSTSDLDLAEAHVAQGRHHIARQKEIIAELRLAGHSTVLAEQLLVAFKQTLASHLSHRDRILAEQRAH